LLTACAYPWRITVLQHLAHIFPLIYFLLHTVKNVLGKTVTGEWLQYSHISLAPLPVEQTIRRTASKIRQSTILLVNATHFDEMGPEKKTLSSI